MIAIGLDIGTTSVSGILADTVKGILKVTSRPSPPFHKTAYPYEKTQDVSQILNAVNDILSELTENARPDCIGVTGQMHGFVYTDLSGNAVSPLYTWQDTRALELYKENMSCCNFITQITGYRVPAGYGLATHFYNSVNRLIPSSACKMLTVHDYIVKSLTRTDGFITHVSDAASWGLYDFDAQSFDYAALIKLSLNNGFLPDISADPVIAGYYDGIPVATALGDNQASFIGSVQNFEDSLLVNVGTGSQITAACTVFPLAERRPLTGDVCLSVGCCLCGGRAYGLVKDFFKEFLAQFATVSDDGIYAALSKLTSDISDTKGLKAVTAFGGTRLDPSARGSLNGIATDNFNPGTFALSVLEGIADELFGFYDQLTFTEKSRFTKIIGSGNGIRKNVRLAEILSKTFSIPLFVPAFTEEAALGACLFAIHAVFGEQAFTNAKTSLIQYRQF